jgi:5-methylthioadenosine/S-adenosylhomocysteine deaminase
LSALFKNDVGRASLDAMEPLPEDVYAGTLISLVGAVAAGITTVVDWYDGPPSDEHIDAALRAHADAQVRTIFVAATNAWPRIASRIGTEPPSRTRLAVGLAADDVEGSVEEWGKARAAGLRIHTIADPSRRDAFTELARRNLLGSDVTVSHCTGLSDEDLDAISSSGAAVVLTPSSDMTSGAGAPPLQALLDRGVRPGLGVDDQGVGASDILAQMRGAISIQHATYFDLKLAGKGGLPNLLSTRDVIRYGTIDGARAVGLDDVTGSIEVGKPADLIVLRTDRPNIHPVNDPIGAVVWGIDTSNLDWVFVGGRPLMHDGILDADASRVAALAEDARRRFGALGATSGVQGGRT